MPKKAEVPHIKIIDPKGRIKSHPSVVGTYPDSTDLILEEVRVNEALFPGFRIDHPLRAIRDAGDHIVFSS